MINKLAPPTESNSYKCNKHGLTMSKERVNLLFEKYSKITHKDKILHIFINLVKDLRKNLKSRSTEIVIIDEEFNNDLICHYESIEPYYTPMFNEKSMLLFRESVTNDLRNMSDAVRAFPSD